jgi:hypothetical protein
MLEKVRKDQGRKTKKRGLPRAKYSLVHIPSGRTYVLLRYVIRSRFQCDTATDRVATATSYKDAPLSVSKFLSLH